MVHHGLCGIPGADWQQSGLLLEPGIMRINSPIEDRLVGDATNKLLAKLQRFVSMVA
jgi:hypothetical protein